MGDMKKLIALLCLSVAGIPLFAQDLLTFGGYHTQLYGYTDKRYVGDDKGDYLKTLAWYGGVDYLQRHIVSDVPELQNFVLGAATNLYVQNDFSSRTLYAVPSQGIPNPETILSDPVDHAGRFQLTLSGFGGFEDDWWGAEAGLSVFLKGFNETSRQKYAPDGSKIFVSGRGWVFDSSLIMPNFLFRLGPEKIPHMVFSLFRGNYDPGYGALVARVVIPLGFGALDVGGTLYQTASIFVEPSVKLGSFDASVRVGTVLNYYDSSFTRVGIFEGAFVSGALDFRW
jgi:hypothetical protein